MTRRAHHHILNSTLIISGIGYFIDAFDMFLYNAVRSPSLRDIGLNDEAITKIGLQILSLQLMGMFCGGYIWGIVGDKIGRRKALICTVLLYSFGSLGSALASNVPFYAAMRFMTGLGVAGETGLGAILAAETLPDKKRNFALMAFVFFSVTAIFVANALPEFLPWRLCYALGGAAGFLLLLARRRLMESTLFEEMPLKTMRGSWQLLKNKSLLKRYICSVLFGLPNYFLANFLITLAPEFSKAVDAEVPIKANVALMAFFAGQFVSEFLAVSLSMLLQSRKKALLLYMGFATLAAVAYITMHHPSAREFYITCSVMGLSSYFVLLLFMAVEQFGTNMRGTLGVSALSTGRAVLIVVNLTFLVMRSVGIDLVAALKWECAAIFCLSFMAYFGLRETYRSSLDFLEGGV